MQMEDAAHGKKGEHRGAGGWCRMQQWTEPARGCLQTAPLRRGAVAGPRTTLRGWIWGGGEP